jgi:hypothetical protein
MEAKVCDHCGKIIAEYICSICNKDLCRRCTRSPEIRIEFRPSRSNMKESYEIYKMCRFNFCTDCNSKVPWNSKDPMDDETHGMILERLKKRILADQIIKNSGGVKDEKKQ